MRRAKALFSSFVFSAALLFGLPAASAAEWEETLEKARGQKVYFNAWGGSVLINDYIAWAAKELEARYGIEVQQVKLADTGDAVARVVAEKAAGRDEGGSVDLIWINGENFASMKREELLFGPFTDKLPNFALVDTEKKPTTLIDFTVPTDGLESPWGMARFNFIHDSARTPKVPSSMQGFLAWAEANPGRFTYPAPPDFLGVSFLKQTLIEKVGSEVLQEPVDQADFNEVTQPLWAYLDQLHPLMWREGKAFPASGANQQALLDSGELDFALSFNPSEAASLIRNGQLPDSARAFVLKEGTLANTHFLAIPYNASAKEAAMVLANFLLSPEAQARKQDTRYWGDGTVLALGKLSEEDRAFFEAIERHPAEIAPNELGRARLEPHPSWVGALERAWRERYAQ